MRRESNMRKNQIVYIGLLIGATILVSFRGGIVAYALFYLCLGIPIISLVYNFYVYKCLQFYQHTPTKIVEKGKLLPYEVVFRNPGFIPFTHVKVHFYDEQCKVEESNQVTEYYLLPGDEKKLNTTLKCFYRGEYSVGVKEIEVMDFLYLFKMTFRVMWFLELTVLPKVIRLKDLSILPNYEDPKSQYHIGIEDVILESDTRKYQVGDSLKQIHWKAVARQGELLTRRISTEIKRENVILMDRTSAEGSIYTKLAVEDKVLEIVLALACYLQTTKIGATVCYEENGLQEYQIKNDVAFGNFYHHVSKLHFNGEKEISNVLEHYLMTHTSLNFYILVTHHLTKALYESIKKALAHGQQIVILYVTKKEEDMLSSNKQNSSIQNNNGTDEETFITQLTMIGSKVYCIKPEDSLEEIIGV